MSQSILPKSDTRTRPILFLLTGQSFFLGLALALLIVTASAIFLTTFGAEKLPYTYIAVALLGSLVSYGLTAAQRYWTLSALAITSVGALAVLFLLAWLALTLANAYSVSFLLLVIFPLYIQIGFVFIGGQAGRLFDVRQIKRLFPRIVSGFAIGFMAGGILTAPLLNLVGKTENLLLATIGGTLALLILTAMTGRRFSSQLNRRDDNDRHSSQQPLRHLLTKRFVLLIFLYQMLSAMGTQLIDYMVYDRATLRFPNTESLAQFVGNFTAVLNLTDILFLALVAGLLLSRYGLSFGLAANPAGVGLFVVGMLAAGLVLGPASTLFFVMVATARIVDIALTDGATRTSLNAAYQALPPADRLAVQTSVEGIGVPLALGLTGAILLLLQAVPGFNILHLVALTLAVTILWAGAGLLVYRGYAANLLRLLKSRALVTTELVLDDSSSLAVVERLVHSDLPREVYLGLDMLLAAGHPTWCDEVVALVSHPNPQIQQEALRRVEEQRVKSALPVVKATMLSARDPGLKSAAIRTFAAIHDGDVIDAITPYLDDPEEETRLGAMVGLLRYGGIPGVLAAGERLTALERAPDPSARRLAAQVTGEVGVQQFYQPLLTLLQDEDLSVRKAALVASSQVCHPDLLPLVMENLDHSGTRSATMTALIAYGESVLPYVSQALAGETGSRRDRLIRLLQICAQLRSENSIVLLKRYVDHPDREVGNHVLAALHSAGYRAGADDAHRLNRILKTDVEHAARILTVQREIGQEKGLEPLQGALDDEFSLLLHRIFLILSLLYDAQAILRAERQLTQASVRSHALVLEMLDVTLAGEHRALVLPLVNPKLTRTQRAQQLSKQIQVPTLSRNRRIRELILDPDGHWARAWLRACAVYGAGILQVTEVADDLAAILSKHPEITPQSHQTFLEAAGFQEGESDPRHSLTDDDLSIVADPAGAHKDHLADSPALATSRDVMRETAAWALHRLAPARLQECAPSLLNDSNPMVRHLAVQAVAGNLQDSA